MARQNRPSLIAFTLLLVAFASFAQEQRSAASTLNVCVYYDAEQGSPYKNGELHAIMLENLLGHFREVIPRLLPVALYRAEGLAGCDRAAYIGSYYKARIPAEFIQDVAAYSRPFLWINYNIEQFQKKAGIDEFSRKTGFVYQDVVGFNERLPPGRIAGFYRYFDYKGKRFSKLAFIRNDGAVIASPDIGLVKNKSGSVLATAVNSDDQRSTPYVIQKEGFYYVADNPFLFIHEQDRYLILADILFDFLGLPPRSLKHYALVRLEDVHPNYDPTLLRSIVDVFKRKHIPFAISLIPEYVAAGAPESAGIDMTKRPAFVQALRYARMNGGDILLHGYTHDVEDLGGGCFPMGSGADYEFWDRCRQKPLPYDSDQFVQQRIAKAMALVRASGFSPVAWVTPHYAASAEDFVAFGKLFKRTVQRVCYSFAGPGSFIFVSQFFPYTIYKDHYGQFVWPENLGFIPMPGSNWGYAAPGDIGVSADLTSVVRDSWASFYWHPQLAYNPGEIKHLERLIDRISADGFEFISLSALKARDE